ncbi:putative OMP leader (16) peptide [Candidatus Similichlamydia laticola]|uniref:Putative OMP leader (16) peptide n=1 Tax=Candidatus Similichlamydia laticola TaxID=2170265 RepID=A0A369KC51_9BACT|nr:putative OMP leader (16) peptide [Candidatus Similichlamydia laticola]
MWKRRFLTLVEMMVVMSLIAIIGAAVAYNIRGSLEKGRYFRSVEGAKQIENLLYMHMAETGESLAATISRWKKIVSRSPLVRSPDQATKDGWGNDYKVKRVVSSASGRETLEVTSEGMMRYEVLHFSDHGEHLGIRERGKDG